MTDTYKKSLNNPFVYKDPNGEFIFSYLTGFIRGLFSKKPWRAFYVGWKTMVNQFKINGGLYTGNFKQIFSRFTWELPQTLVGYGWSQLRNHVGKVNKVKYFDGATFAMNTHSSKREGVTIGSFININIKEYNKEIYEPKGKFTLVNDPLFMHEYGHYIQSQKQGWGYLFTTGIPSLIDAAKNHYATTIKDNQGKRHTLKSHDIFWAEINANKKAEKYFKEKYGVEWKGKDFIKYPLEYPK